MNYRQGRKSSQKKFNMTAIPVARQKEKGKVGKLL